MAHNQVDKLYRHEHATRSSPVLMKPLLHAVLFGKMPMSLMFVVLCAMKLADISAQVSDKTVSASYSVVSSRW